MSHDPLDTVTALGYRVVWVENFDYRVAAVDDLQLMLIDPRVERPAAASAALGLLESPETYDGIFEAS